MLDPWIIEEIRRREREEADRQEKRPEVEMPLHGPRPHETDDKGHGKSDDVPRGVTIIDFSV